VRHTSDLQNDSPVTPLPHAGSASQTLTNLAPLEDHHGLPCYGAPRSEKTNTRLPTSHSELHDL
jgi:hypothetical protein